MGKQPTHPISGRPTWSLTLRGSFVFAVILTQHSCFPGDAVDLQGFPNSGTQHFQVTFVVILGFEVMSHSKAR